MRQLSISLSKEELSNFEEAIQKEWVVTNGLGGYASSTALGINTRKYHGLLVAALHPPGDRRVCLTKLDEEVKMGNKNYLLGGNEFQNGIFPKGHLFLQEFSLSPFPRYTYMVGNIQVEKKIFIPHEKNAAVIVYNILNKSGLPVKIRVFPLINGRHFHSVTDRWNTAWRFEQKPESREVEVRFGASRSTLKMWTTEGRYLPTGKWVEKVCFREEERRGESHLDDWYQPGYFEVNLREKKTGKFAVTAIATTTEDYPNEILTETSATLQDVEASYEREIRRRQNLLKKFYEENKKIPEENWLDWIFLATEMFIARGIPREQKSVIAGYHWFETWGRDTFISLPGLMLVTGRFQVAREVFLTFRDHCKQGLIPNLLPDQTGQPTYNSVDATLWYVNAVLQYLKYTGDFRFIQQQLWKTLQKAIQKYERGTAFDIHMGRDGLLHHGPQLTWMDAAIDGRPVTPRGGMAVEVQALWYNALKTMELLANKFKEKKEAERYVQMAEKTKNSFDEIFWNADKNFLFDCITQFGKDEELRPNQIMVVALDFTMLDEGKNKRVVDVVHQQLLTPYGLRTLAPDEPGYRGVYAGDRRSRDQAYHNGTVWPWLLGPFTTAFIKTKSKMENRDKCAPKNFLAPLLTNQIFNSGLGTLNEVFDGEPPHTARGCIAQAWSVAEPLRAYIEDVLQITPEYETEVLKPK